MSKVYHLKTIQKIPIGIEEAWDFFSSPENLKIITPEKLDFRIRSEANRKMYAGQIIEYTVKPLLGIPLYWMTEITHVKENQYFVDEQRFGPYSLWHHQHHFKEIDGGVEMTDLVHYKLPLFFMSGAANELLVKKQLKEIFDYRFKKVEQLFPKKI